MLHHVLRHLGGLSGVGVGQSEHIVRHHSPVHACVAWDGLADPHDFLLLLLRGFLASLATLLLILEGLLVEVEVGLLLLSLAPEEIVQNFFRERSLVLLLWWVDPDDFGDFFILYFI